MRQAKNHKFLTGFTLIEIIVSLMIFSIALIAIGAIFLSITKSQRKTTILRRIQSEAHYALEVIAQEVRDDDLDYASYPSPIPSPIVSSLTLIRGDGKKVSFYSGTTDHLLKMRIDTGAEINILSNTIKVDNLRFYITPSTDPFVQSGPNTQPRVTIAFTLSENKVNAQVEEKSSIKIQNTISLRMYRR